MIWIYLSKPGYLFQENTHKYYKRLITSIMAACHRLITQKVLMLDKNDEYFQDDFEEFITEMKKSATKVVSPYLNNLFFFLLDLLCICCHRKRKILLLITYFKCLVDHFSYEQYLNS